MKSILWLFTLSLLCFIIACSGNKKAVKSTTNKAITEDDKIEYYETEVEATQKNDLANLLGNWSIINMRRQQKAELEVLSNVNLNFTSEKVNGKAPCNTIGGNFKVKGTSIKFSEMVATRMACDKLEVETAYLKLLENTVSAFSVQGNKLLLRDGSSNIVFEGERIK